MLRLVVAAFGNKNWAPRVNSALAEDPGVYLGEEMYKLLEQEVSESAYIYTGLFISPSGTSELDCATTKKDTAERSISIGREYLKVFFLY